MYKKTTILIMLILGFSLLISHLYGFECDFLDPRHEVLKEVDSDIKGTAEALFSLGRLDGELNTRAREEVRNLYMSHTNADKMDLNNRLIYFLCIMLKDAKDLTDFEKLDRFNAFVGKIMKEEDHEVNSQVQNYDGTQSRTQDLIWEIGEKNDSLWEFNLLKHGEQWPWRFEIPETGSTNSKRFPQEINDGVRRPILISFSLSREYTNRDLILSLETVSGSGNDFTMSFFITGPGDQDNRKEQIDVRTFKVHEHDKQEVLIPERFLREEGRYTITIDNASPPFSGRWIFWDYLALKTVMQ